jgi:hypothetical protein
MQADREVFSEARMGRELKRLACLGLVNLILLPALLSVLSAQNKPQNHAEKEAAPMKLKVGDTAPDFTLPSTAKN